MDCRHGPARYALIVSTYTQHRDDFSPSLPCEIDMASGMNCWDAIPTVALDRLERPVHRSGRFLDGRYVQQRECI